MAEPPGNVTIQVLTEDTADIVFAEDIEIHVPAPESLQKL
jgi:hypothetical protein